MAEANDVRVFQEVARVLRPLGFQALLEARGPQRPNVIRLRHDELVIGSIVQVEMALTPDSKTANVVLAGLRAFARYFERERHA